MRCKLLHGICLTALLASCTASETVSEEKQAACVVEEDGIGGESADGVVDARHTREFDETGRLIRSEHDTTNNLPEGPLDGRSDSFTEYHYDFDDRLIEEKDYYEGRLEPYNVKTYDYDDAGRLVREQSDFDLGGVAALDTRYTYGEFGVTEIARLAYGSDTIESRSYREDGNLDAIESRRDGVLEFSKSYEYDGDLKLVSSTRTHFGDTESRVLERYEYGPDGLISGFTIDEGADGSIDGRNNYEYDSAGRLLSEESDCDLDGEVDWRNSYAYDRKGRLVEQSIDSGEHENNITTKRRFDYSCHD
jgi:hypothetical protein